MLHKNINRSWLPSKVANEAQS